MTAEAIDFAAGWAALEAEVAGESTLGVARVWSRDGTAAPPSNYKHYRPFVSAVDKYVEEAQETNRIYLGVEDFDRQMRGIGRKHLLLLNGFAHSGKTLFGLHILRHNRTKRVAWFTQDESAEQVLANLASMQTGVAAEELERRIQQDDREALDLLRRVASEEFPNLAVFEEPMTPGYIYEALEEAADAWGERHDLVVIDFVRLLRVGEDMNAKFEFVKSLSKTHGPVIALNQTSRSAGADGRKLTISSGEYGGETYASFVLGVRRKVYECMALRDELELKAKGIGKAAADAQERLPAVRQDIARHEHTVTVNAVKVKRVGGRLVDEIDFDLDHRSGILTPLGETDLPRAYAASVSRGFTQRKPIYEQDEFEEF